MDWISSVLNWLKEKILNIVGYSPPSVPELLPALKKINDYVFEVYKPPRRPSVEIVFFHGLQLEDSRDPHVTTWVSRDKSEMWLQWLHQDFPDARILTILFDAFSRRTVGKGVMDMYSTSENMVNSFTWNEAEVGQDGCPVVLVGHCLGGLIMKDFCVQAHAILTTLDQETRQKAAMEDLLLNVKGLFYYATPHHGSRLTDNVWFRKGSLFKDLTLLNTETARRNEVFRKLRRKYRWKTFGVVGNHTQNIRSLGFTGMVVTEASAREDVDGFHTIDADHFDVCRPVSRQSDSFQLLLNFVNDVLKEDKKGFPNEGGLLAGLETVGLEARIKTVIEKLRVARRLAIVGIGGIGKTTLAKAVFDRISTKFEYVCFLDEVKKEMAKEENPRHLRKKILIGLKKRGRDVDSSFRWSTLKGKRVLIILDDVESESQVEVMTKLDDFSEESRLIVTSRNGGFLRRQHFELHIAQELSLDESKELFCCHAFNQSWAPPGYSDRITKFANKCGGFPLALKVSGRSLYMLDKAEWDDALERLSRAQPIDGNDEDQLWSFLMVSIKSLASSEYEMFLDVATCFYGCDLREVQLTWSLCSWAPASANLGWRNLSDRYLVSKEFDGGDISMHQVVRDLGRKLARHSRVVGVQKLKHLSEQEKSTVKVLNLTGRYDAEELKIDNLDAGFTELEILWVFKFRKLQALESLGELQALRQVKIDFCECFKGLPSTLGQLQALQYLRIRSATDQSFTELPESLGKLRALRHLILENCCYLKALPKTLGQLQALEHLVISLCRSLIGLPESVGQLRALRYLKISDCESFEALPNTLAPLQALEDLTFQSQNLSELPKSVGQLRALRHLDIRGSVGILPNTLEHLQALKHLKVSRWCSLTESAESFGHLRALRHLEISNWELGALPATLGQLQGLEHLEICNCDSLTELPESVGQLRALRHLKITWCKSLKALPSTLGQLQALQQLVIFQCHKFTEVPESIGQLSALRHLEIISCDSLKALPNTLHQLQALQHLKIIWCPDLTELPESVGQLRGLRHLEIIFCGSLKWLPNNLGQLHGLEYLKLATCSALTELPETIGQLRALKHLIIQYCHLMELSESIGQLSALQQLEIRGCDYLEALPNTLGQLGALEYLIIDSCRSLKSLPYSLGQLPALEHMDIKICPLLRELPEWAGQLKQVDLDREESSDSDDSND